jgi:hypothetical protein
MAKLEARIAAKQQQFDKASDNLSFQEDRLDAYDTLVSECEEAYEKVPATHQLVENAGRLVSVLHQECDGAEEKFLGSQPPNAVVGNGSRA